MTPPSIRRVLDASAAIQLLLGSDSDQDFVRLLDTISSGDGVCCVPVLFFYETADALSRTPELQEPQMSHNLSTLYRMGLEVFSLGPEDLTEAMRLARLKKVRVTDATYIVLARHLGAVLVTADRRMADAAKGEVEVEYVN